MAPDSTWYTPEFIDAHPTWLFGYGDCAPESKSSDPVPKDSDNWTKGTPLARVCRPRPNTLPYTVCHADGTALNDSTVKKNKLSFQKTTRRMLARGRSKRIDVIVLPPDERIDLYQDFVSNAPATAAALNDQLNHLRRQAVDFVPKASQSKDSGAETWHTSESQRELKTGTKDFIELDAVEACDLDDTDPTNYWGRRCGSATWSSDFQPPDVKHPDVKTIFATLNHPLGQGH